LNLILAPRLFPSFRFLVGVFAFLGLGIIYMQRVNMGLAVLCMTNHTALILTKSNQNMNVSDETDISSDLSKNKTQKCFLKTNKQILIVWFFSIFSKLSVKIKMVNIHFDRMDHLFLLSSSKAIFCPHFFMDILLFKYQLHLNDSFYFHVIVDFERFQEVGWHWN